MPLAQRAPSMQSPSLAQVASQREMLPDVIATELETQVRPSAQSLFSVQISPAI